MSRDKEQALPHGHVREEGRNAWLFPGTTVWPVQRARRLNGQGKRQQQNTAPRARTEVFTGRWGRGEHENDAQTEE